MSEKPVNRRMFFRQGLRELLKPISNAIAPVERVAREIGALEERTEPPRPAEMVAPIRGAHRPPGALPEAQFDKTCSRCGECVRVCPAQCIKLDPSGKENNGLPYIDPDEMPCVLCDGLLCMPACPTGALVITPLVQIRMGTAAWREPICLRTEGQDCTICIDSCPVGTVALELREGKVHVIESGCTGCGVCQNRCPTHPKSIVVIPASMGVPARQE